MLGHHAPTNYGYVTDSARHPQVAGDSITSYSRLLYWLCSRGCPLAHFGDGRVTIFAWLWVCTAFVAGLSDNNMGDSTTGFASEGFQRDVIHLHRSRSCSVRLLGVSSCASCFGDFDGALTDSTAYSMSTPRKWPNHALQRTRPSRSGCNHSVPWAGSLSLGR